MSAQIINLPRWGATSEEWAHFDLALGLTEDLLPVVSNPNVAISPESKMKQVGKTPSRFNGQRQVVGIASWTSHVSTSSEVDRWSRDADLGICLQTRSVRALDIDVDDRDEAVQIGLAIMEAFGFMPPARTRANASKFLCLFRLPGDMPKRVIRTQHGIIEFLATGQQAVIAGTHTSGVRYEWQGGLPDTIPEMSKEEFETLWAALVRTFAVEAPIESKSSTKAQQLQQAASSDPVAQFLLDKGLVLSGERDGRLHIACPWKDEHTTESPDSGTSYFPAHTGGYERGHFKCLHAHCSHRTDAEFKDALEVPRDDDFADFDVVESEEGEVVVKKLRFEFIDDKDFKAGKPQTWLIKDVLPKAELGVLFGASGSGKSFFALDLAASIANGGGETGQWRGKKVTKGRVGFIAAEGAAGFRQRIQAYCTAYGLGEEGIGIKILAAAPNFMEKADVVELSRAMGHDLDLLFVDTLAQVTPGANENAGDDMGRVIALCGQLHRATGAMIVLIHHSGKDASKGARGWSGIKGALNVELEVVRSGNDRVAIVSKMKDGLGEGDQYGFELRSVEIGQSEDPDDIEPLTSCVVDYVDAPFKSKKELGPKGKIEVTLCAIVDSSQDEEVEGFTPDTILDEYVRLTPSDPRAAKDRRKEVARRAYNQLVKRGVLVYKARRIRRQDVEQ